MATNIIKIIDSQDKVVSQTQVTSGKSVTISAKEGQSYEFVSGATKRAPDEIKTTREGNNLKVEIKDGDATSTTIIEDYYTNGEGDLVGLAEDGHFYNFVPEEMGNDYMVTDLADGVSSFQALGSEGDSMSPWWLGLPLLALGAAGGGGGSGAANTLDTTAPDAPSNLTVEDNYDAQWYISNHDDSDGFADVWGADKDTGSWSINNSGSITPHDNVNVTSDGKIITNDNTPTLSGTGEVGATVNVYGENGDVLATTTVDSDGKWSIEVDLSELHPYSPYTSMDMFGQPGGGNQGEDITLSVTLTDAAGNESEKSDISFILDTLTASNINNITLTDGTKTMESSLESYAYFTGTSLTMSDNFMSYAVDNNGTNTAEDIIYREGSKVYVTLTEITFSEDSNGDTIETRGAEHRIGVESSAVVDVNGKWSVNIDFAAYGLQDGMYDAEIMVRDISGDMFGISNGKVLFGIDQHAPETTIIENGVSNSHIVSFEVRDFESLTTTLSGELIGLGVEKLIFNRDGELAGEKHIAENDKTTWEDTSVTQDGVYMYQVKAVDVAGNESEWSDKAWVIFDSDNEHDLTNADVAGKDFSEMVLVGNTNSETFIVDNVGFHSIDGGDGAGTDTLKFDADLTLDSNSGEIKGFEVFDVGSHTLTINDNDKIEDGMHINGSGGEVDLNFTWSTDHVVTDHYYTYNNGTENIYIHENVTVTVL
jgi:hypothetical protein